MDSLLTSPRPPLVEFIRQVESPLLVLGAAGKMGPTLCLLAKRAADLADHKLDIIAVSRFSQPSTRQELEQEGIRTIVCDLLDRDAVAALPESSNVIALAGLKFGTSKNPAATWAVNTIIPANVVDRYRRARIVALSTGNVYPFSPVTRFGSGEGDPLTPLGEYANAAVARERIYEFYAAKHNTSLALLRLFYAVELRYGVLVDIAQKIIEGTPIDLTNGFFNCIWQGDANDMILRSLTLASSPPSVWNLCQPAVFSLRDVAADLGEILGAAPLFKNSSTETALLGKSQRICQALGNPPTPFRQVVRWTADWVKRGGRNLGRPTHFEVRDGAY